MGRAIHVASGLRWVNLRADVMTTGSWGRRVGVVLGAPGVGTFRFDSAITTISVVRARILGNGRPAFTLLDDGWGFGRGRGSAGWDFCDLVLTMLRRDIFSRHGAADRSGGVAAVP